MIRTVPFPTNHHMDTNSSTGPSYRPILDLAWTETLYMVEPGGFLWTSKTHRAVQDISEKPKAERRFNITERLILTALDILQRDCQPQKSCANSEWPTLCQTVFPTSASGGQGFPFLAWYGDFDGCNHHNWIASSGEMVSVPIFTWDRLLALYHQRYPWAEKTPRVLWRGGMTGVIHNATTKCPRWRLV